MPTAKERLNRMKTADWEPLRTPADIAAAEKFLEQAWPAPKADGYLSDAIMDAAYIAGGGTKPIKPRPPVEVG